ncbi:hypothetical protein PHET_08925 [Paragonimus heterotremus]|uniref:Uncharacterized protein n=1 Tax=Paragonimus heterotremus TaxID=100268 RepID=A0A8J4WUU2_9TREM|nr:hypothetical protein PHET_08925 [Paragonimus heterotremus]
MDRPGYRQLLQDGLHNPIALNYFLFPQLKIRDLSKKKNQTGHDLFRTYEELIELVENANPVAATRFLIVRTPPGHDSSAGIDKDAEHNVVEMYITLEDPFSG